MPRPARIGVLARSKSEQSRAIAADFNAMIVRRLSQDEMGSPMGILLFLKDFQLHTENRRAFFVDVDANVCTPAPLGGWHSC
jgi:hypothetical protein